VTATSAAHWDLQEIRRRLESRSILLDLDEALACWQAEGRSAPASCWRVG
jgi:hypothetical protein